MTSLQMRKRVCRLGALLFALAGCRTAGESQRMTIAAALNVYSAKRAVYVAACIPTPPALAEACWAWRDALADCYVRIEAATKAAGIGDATPQLDAMQKPCAVVKALGEKLR